jgi:hypothetical protein
VHRVLRPPVRVNVAKATVIVTVKAGTESLKCQAPDRRSG